MAHAEEVDVPQVTWTAMEPGERAEFFAATALEDVIGWFQDQGEDRDACLERCDGALDRLFADEAVGE